MYSGGARLREEQVGVQVESTVVPFTGSNVGIKNRVLLSTIGSFVCLLAFNRTPHLDGRSPAGAQVAVVRKAGKTAVHLGVGARKIKKPGSN